jgi:hypothetical protein
MIPHQTLIGRVWPADTHRFVCIRRKWKIRLETSLMPNLGYSAIKVMSWMDISRYCRLIWEPSNCYMIMISLTCGTSNWVLDSCFLRSKCSENLFRKLFAEKNLRKSFGAAAVVLALPCYLTPAVKLSLRAFDRPATRNLVSRIAAAIGGIRKNMALRSQIK